MLDHIDIPSLTLLFLTLGVGALGLAYARAGDLDDKSATSNATDADPAPRPQLAPSEPSRNRGRVPTPDQVLVRATRIQLGLSQAQFAELIGTPLPTLRAWEDGRLAPPGAAVALVRLLARHPGLMGDLAA